MISAQSDAQVGINSLNSVVLLIIIIYYSRRCKTCIIHAVKCWCILCECFTSTSVRLSHL